MKIIWISFYGSWTLPLLNVISPNNKMGLLIPVIQGKKDNIEIKNDITFYSIAFSKKECFIDMSNRTFCKYKKVIDEFKPDIIHVHGTEKNLAQIQNFIKEIPVVISIQGLLTGCKPYTFNYLERRYTRKFQTLKNYLGWGGVNLMHKNICKGAKYEENILNNGKYFIGRTHWDKSYILFHNPQAKYFQGEELLRDEFYQSANSWDISKCKRHSIFMPAGFNPIKGLHMAIETIYLLKQYFSDVELVVPGLSENLLTKSKLINRIWGEEYIIYIKYLVEKYNLKNNITFLPRLDARDMIKQMQQANVFISPSSIDNSPNAVGESTMIGVPIVTTPVGGIPSFMTDGKTALFAPAGDPYTMAYQIKRIFENDELATNLSANAYQLALIRHDKVKTAEQYLNIYHTIITEHHT